MTSRTAVAVLPAALALAFGAGAYSSALPEDDAPRGVIVEKVAKGGAAERAGLQPGDEILAWTRAARAPANPEPGQGTVALPLDLTEVEIEQAPRGPLTLTGRRGAEALRWSVPPAEWLLEARPSLSGPLLELYQQGRERQEAKATDEAVQLWRLAATQARAAGDCAVAGWFLGLGGKALGQARRWDDVDAAYRDAVEASRCDDRPMRTALLQRAGCWVRWPGPPQPAAECLTRAAARIEEIAPGSLLAARGAFDRAAGASSVEDVEAEGRFHRQALEMRERQAPGSEAVATSHNYLGIAAYNRGDLDTAGKHFEESLRLWERLAPDGIEIARVLNALGELGRQRGNLKAADAYHQRALAIRRRLIPDSADLAYSLNNLGIVARYRGDLAGSELYLTEALRLSERVPEASRARGLVLNNMALTAREQGDLDAAESFLHQALATYQEQSPGSMPVAHALNNLGLIAIDRGKLDEAEDLLQRSLALKAKVAPGSLAVASTIENLGQVALGRGDFAGAEARYLEGLALREKEAPGSLDVADSFYTLGELARARRDYPAAERHLGAALALQEKLRPDSTSVADTLHALGLARRQDGRSGPAGEALCAAPDVLDRLRERLGRGHEARSAFGAKYADYYHDCLESLLDQRRTAEAFHVLERSRARALLDLLAEREALTAAGAPEVEERRRQLDAEYDRVQAELADLGAGHEAEVERLRGRLRELGVAQQEIRDEVRRSSPRFAALRYPQPLDAAGAAAALDPGTVLLAYAVGKERTHAFVLRRSEAGAPLIEVFPIPLGRQALEDRVRSYRERIGQAGPAEELSAEAGALYDALVQPAEAYLGAAQRVLLSPDGPLHRLPFAALRRKGRYFVEWKPLHTVISATVYAELRRFSPGAPAPARLIAFGDPRYPPPDAAAAADPGLRDGLKRGLDLRPLPASRREVEAIAGLYGKEARVYVGEQATEGRVKAEAAGGRYIHFACHGFYDERMPLNSALALTIPVPPTAGQDNGLLQAWEILEHVHLDADLVTLSACDSGLGKEMGGEGLIGLTRAFQYAGARSVVASLWSVYDRSTADLMRHFYGALRRGVPKDEALRRAQVALIQGGPQRSHPLSWAAFQLFGDWK